MGLFDFFDDAEREPGMGGAAKRVVKSTVQSVAGGTVQQMKVARDDFFKSFMPDLYGQISQQDAAAQAMQQQGGALPDGAGGDPGSEQPDAAALVKMQQMAGQTGGGQWRTPVAQGQAGGANSQYPGIRTQEEEQRYQQLRQRLHSDYFAPIGDIDTVMQMRAQQKKQEEEQKKQEEEQAEEQKKQQKKQEELQIREKEQVENQQAKREKMPAGAG